MTPSLSIKCCRSDALVSITKDGDGYCLVDFRGRGFSGKLRVYDHRWEALPVFFKDISDNWRGWVGEKRLETLEGNLQFVATSNNVGNILLAIELEDHDGVVYWKTAGALHLEAGGLDSISALAARMFA